MSDSDTSSDDNIPLGQFAMNTRSKKSNWETESDSDEVPLAKIVRPKYWTE